MKVNIHPVYYNDAKVICACGNTFTTGSTKQIIKIEICSSCHPFFTGQMKFVDAQGQIQKFQAKQQTAAKMADQVAKKRAKKLNIPQEEKKPLTLKEMLMQQ
jgi:large subunit ribosomal protein L31